MSQLVCVMLVLTLSLSPSDTASGFDRQSAAEELEQLKRKVAELEQKLGVKKEHKGLKFKVPNNHRTLTVLSYTSMLVFLVFVQKCASILHVQCMCTH